MYGHQEAAEVIEAGAGPLVILVHSSMSGARQWSALMKELTDRFWVRAINLPGYGRTPAWPEARSPSLDDYARLVAATVPDAAEGIGWAQQQVVETVAEEYALAATTLEDVYIRLTGDLGATGQPGKVGISMAVKLDRDLEPMLARLGRELPHDGYLYEPKWDGFRCLAFRDGAEVDLRSRNHRPLGWRPRIAPRRISSAAGRSTSLGGRTAPPANGCSKPRWPLPREGALYGRADSA
jgi:hypothetical protein